MFDNEINRINVFSKEVSTPVNKDYCEDVRILPAVRDLYHQYKEECNRFIHNDGLFGLPPFDPDNRRFYVYAWHTKTEPKMYFYVGKGTGNRCKHILSDIKDYKNGKKNSRYKWYSVLQDKFGIDYEFAMKDLSDYEAIIYEQALKVHLTKAGEVLLNVEGSSIYQSLEGWQDRHVEIPTVENSILYRRYMDFDDVPSFDKVNREMLNKVYLYPYGSGRDEAANAEEIMIRQWINTFSGKIFSKGDAKGVQAIIVFRYLSEERYRAYKDLGKKIYSSTDVVGFLQKGYM